MIFNTGSANPVESICSCANCIRLSRLLRRISPIRHRQEIGPLSQLHYLSLRNADAKVAPQIALGICLVIPMLWLVYFQ